MVKKIRRRVEKTPDAEPVTEITEDFEEGGFAADLERFAEDSFTRSIVDGLKFIHAYRKPFLLLAIAGLAAFVFAQLSELTAQEELGSEAEILGKALSALEEAQGPSLGAMARGEESEKLTDEQRQAKLASASRDFASLTTASTVHNGGQASAQFALGSREKAATLYRTTFEASANDKLVQAVSLNGQAAALEDTGKVAEALEVWKQIAALDQAKLGTMAALEQARLLIQLERADEARAVIDGVDTAKLSPFGLKPKVEQLQGLLPKSTK